MEEKQLYLKVLFNSTNGDRDFLNTMITDCVLQPRNQCAIVAMETFSTTKVSKIVAGASQH